MRDAQTRPMRSPPQDWDIVDETSDNCFPASDPASRWGEETELTRRTGVETGFTAHSCTLYLSENTPQAIRSPALPEGWRWD